jgi:hypothetical protein
MSTPELRKKYKAWWRKYNKIRQDYEAECDRVLKALKELPLGYHPLLDFPPEPPHLPLPKEFQGMTCGAKTRAGTSCKLTSIYPNGRCKFHGGLSTGPKTEAGRKRSALNGRKAKKGGPYENIDK